MNIAALAIRYRVITWFMIFLVIFGGLSSYKKLGRLEDPEFTIKDAQVVTMYPGATALEVSEEVTDVIETAVQELGQLDYVRSVSSPGRSIVKVSIKDAYDKTSLPQVWDELRRKVGDAQGKLPPGASSSIVNDSFGDVYGVVFSVYGDGYSYAELEEYAKLLRRELLLVQDVGKISLAGVQQEVVYVEISRDRMAQLGISPQEIYATLSGANLIGPAGAVKVDSQYIRIEPTGKFDNVEEIGELLVLQGDADAAKIYIKDIAQIYRGYQEPANSYIHFDAKPGVVVSISTVAGGNVVTMGQAIYDRMIELQEETPIGIEIGVIAMQSDSVTTAISGFIVSLMEAILIVVGVLMITMGLRSGLLIGLILLLTVLGTFICMLAQGVMLERISLGALIIALGMLVDNAIVVVEGILIGAGQGMTRKEAAIKIVQQTMWPLLGATLVAILAFAAIGVSQDSTGEYCKSLFLVLMYSLLFSWILAITVTPVLGVLFLREKKTNKSSGEQEDPYAGALYQGYKGFLRACIRFRAVTLVVLLLALVAAIYGFGFVKKSFFPDSTRPQFMVHYWLPQGTHIDRTAADVEKIEEYILGMEEVEAVSSFIGAAAPRFLLTYSPEEPNTAYALSLVSVEDYRIIPELMDRIQKGLEEQFPDGQTMTRRFVLGPGDANKIQVRLRGPDTQKVRLIAEQVREIMLDDPTTRDVNDDWRQLVPLIRPVIAEAQARDAGITRADILTTLQTTFSGTQIGVYRENDKLLPIITRPPENERDMVDEIRNVQIYSPVARTTIPLTQFIHRFETVSEDQIIRRRNRLPTLTVMGDPVAGVQATDAFNSIRPHIEEAFNSFVQDQHLSGYTLEWGGEYENSGDAQAALASKLPFTALLMVMIVVILFNSIRQPLVIFLTVPLAIIGVTVGLLVMGQPFGFMALLGFLSLAGMLIKNAIVLIDEINVQMASGKEPCAAIVDSGVSRLRPVSMAALTTVLGMIPLLTDAFYVAMAVTIMFGLTFATILTLVVVPVLYAVFFKIPYKPEESA